MKKLVIGISTERGKNMKRSPWTIMIGASGFLIGLAMVSFVTQRVNEITIIFLILGVIFGFIGIWRHRKYLDKWGIPEK